MGASVSLSQQRTWILALLLAIGLGASACLRPQPIPEGCGKDTDCRGTRICGPQSRCIEAPPAPVAAAIDAGAEPPQADAAVPVDGPPPYAMYGGNAQNTGRLAGPAPLQKPQQRWVVSTADAVAGSPTIGPDGTIYVASHDGHLYAVSEDGAVRWRFSTGDRIWSTPAVAEDNTIYIGSDDDHLYAIDGATGALRWQFRIGKCDPPIGFGPEGVRCDVDGGPTIGPDGTVYTGGDGVYAVWPDGTLRWKFATAERVSTAPALAPAGTVHAGTVYAGCLDDALYAIRSDGTRAWAFRTRRDIESSPAVGPDGTIYLGADDHVIYALNPDDGTVRWKVLTAGFVRSSPAIGDDGTIYVGSYDGHLYAIAPQGGVKWRFAAADKIHSSPAIAQNGIVLFGSQDDHLYAVSPEGVLLWYIAFDGDVDATAVVSRDGILYAASDDKTLRAFE